MSKYRIIFDNFVTYLFLPLDSASCDEAQMKANQMLQNGEYLLTNGSLSLNVSKIKRTLLPCSDITMLCVVYCWSSLKLELTVTWCLPYPTLPYLPSLSHPSPTFQNLKHKPPFLDDYINFTCCFWRSPGKVSKEAKTHDSTTVLTNRVGERSRQLWFLWVNSLNRVVVLLWRELPGRF